MTRKPPNFKASQARTADADLPAAETLALQALAFILSDDDRRNRFLGLTGLDGGAVRSLPGNLAGLGAVLDHLLGWEPELLAFCAETDLPPARVAAARRLLPGGDMLD
ncbi:MAG: DUF3572 domain-containing protein [Rhodospirillaceae bacterium]|nr:DUF3572 domain-containing protein [Rhodospirillaceae bacterium]